MDKINLDNNISIILKTRTNSFTLFDGIQYEYKKFLLQMENSDFKNASTRYVAENAILQKLYTQAKQDAPEKTKAIAKRIDEVTQILKKQGITIKY